MNRPVALGIDLGTTHTLAARVVNGVPVCLPLDEGEGALLASVVSYAADGTPYIGAAARRSLAVQPERAVASSKRSMGRRETAWTIDGRPIAPVEVAAEILGAVKARVEAAGLIPGTVVVTVPAYFDEAQRQATREAGRRAGLSVQRILAEPTAAALAYGLERNLQGRYAVYDLGGGTFDLSILSLEDGLFQVLATRGDTALGGDDFDRALLDHATALGWLDGAGPREPLLLLARAARERLTLEESAPLGSGILTRDAFDALPAVAALVERTMRLTRLALRDAELSPEDLDGIVLVGGMTRTPLVRREIARLFGRPPHLDLDPDRVVAMGAALQAERLAGGARDDFLLLDVTPLSLGLELMGGVVERLIPRNSPIPTSAQQIFATFRDGQTAIDFHVVQGERELAADCRSLGRFKLRGLPARAAGAVQVEVTFALDSDGLLRVSAREQGGEASRVFERVTTHGLADEGIEAALFEAIDHADADMDARLLREARVEAERLSAETRKRLADHAFLLEEGEREPIEALLAELDRTSASDDANRILLYREGLSTLAAPFFERALNWQLARRCHGRSVDGYDKP